VGKRKFVSLLKSRKDNNNMDRKEIIHDMKEIIQSVSPGAEIILFGSEARGDSKPDSDIDVLILVNKEKLSFEDKSVITDPLYDIEIKTGVSISPIVYTKKQWDSRPFKTPFYINVMNEGIAI
jgi:uncharacterized protein